MRDEELKQAIAELQEVVRCRCNEAYRDRGLHDPQCECDSAEAVKIVADHIKALTAKLAKAVEALEDISGNGNAAGRNPQLMSAKAIATLADIKGVSHE